MSSPSFFLRDSRVGEHASARESHLEETSPAHFHFWNVLLRRPKQTIIQSEREFGVTWCEVCFMKFHDCVVLLFFIHFLSLVSRVSLLGGKKWDPGNEVDIFCNGDILMLRLELQGWYWFSKKFYQDSRFVWSTLARVPRGVKSFPPDQRVFCTRHTVQVSLDKE